MTEWRKIYSIPYALCHETLKFIQTSDDLSMPAYLYYKTDDNICLYRMLKLSSASFGEQDLTSVDLNSFCNDDSRGNTCSNALRFSDRESPGKIKEFGDVVTCKCFNSFYFTNDIIYS